MPDPFEPNPITAWYLDKITTPKGQVINFTYSTENYSTETYSFSERYRLQINPSSASVCSTPTDLKTSAFKTGTIVRYLKKISIAGTSNNVGSRIDVLFSHSDRDDIRAYHAANNVVYEKPQRLDRVEVKAYDHVGSFRTIKDIRFNYSYTNVPYGSEFPEMGKRMILDNVKLYEGAESIGEYTLEYNGDLLPKKNSHQKDYWGYFNSGSFGAVATLIPKTTLQFEQNGVISNLIFDGADRKSDEASAKAQVLRKITYPTGGNTTFDFELNEFYDQNQLQISGNQKKEYNFLQSGPGKKVIEITSPVIATIISSIKYKAISCYGSINDPVFPTSGWPSGSAATITRVDNGSIPGGLDYSSLHCVGGPGNASCWNITTTGSMNPCGILKKQEEVELQPGIYIMEVDDDDEWFSDIRISYKHPIEIEDNPKIAETKGGGLRIKKMVDNDGITADNDIVRYYEYDETLASGLEVSSGKLITYPVYAYIDYSAVAGSPGLAEYLFISLSFCKDLTLSSNSNRSFSNAASGSPIGYTQVTVKQGVNGDGGKTIYSYENEQDVESTSSTANYIANSPTTDFSYKNGSLLSQTEFDFKGNEVSKIVNNYSDINAFTNTYFFWYVTNGEFDKSLLNDQTFNIGNVPIFYFRFYQIRNRFYRLDNTVSYQYYYQNGQKYEFSNETKFTYNLDHRMLLSSTMDDALIDADNDVIKSETYYALDHPEAPQAMLDQHIHNLPIESKSFKNENQVGGLKYIYSAHSDKQNMVLMDEIKSYNSEDDAYEQRVVLEYDSKGNITEMNVDGYRTSFIWGYNSSLPIVKAENVKHSDLKAAFDSNQDLRATFPNGIILEYSHLAYVGLRQVNDPNNLSTTYSFDNNGRLLSILDTSGNKLFDFKYLNSNK